MEDVDIEKEKQIELSDIQKKNLSNILTNNFITGTSKDSVEGIRFAKEDGTFSVILINKTPLNEILKGKTYHSFDIALNKTQWGTFVKNVCRKLEKI